MNSLKIILLSASLITIFGSTDKKPVSTWEKEYSPEEIFTFKEVPVNEMNSPAGSSSGYSSLPSTQDSIIYENDSVFTIESYKDELSKDGEWIKTEKDEIDPEGVSAEAGDEIDGDINREWVWRPHIYDPDWTPYTNGYWVYTNCGWMWISYYHWGWRTCHYGRWWWSNRWGWVWSPGFVWAPAWVVWMYWDGYCGWYPISPRVRWHRHHGWRCHNMRFRVRHWRFCNYNNFTVHLNKEVILDPRGNKELIDKATFRSEMNIADRKVVNKGPDVRKIETAINKKIAIDDATKFNNVRSTVSRDNERKNDERKINGSDNYRNNDQGNKNNKDNNKNKDGYRNNDGKKNNDGNKNNNGYRNNDQNRNSDNQKNNDQNRGSEKKSNDNVKKDYKYDKPQDNYRKQEPSQKNDNYNKQESPQKKNNSYKKQESPPKSNDSYKKKDSSPKNDNSYRKVEKKQSSTPVKKDNGRKKENYKTDDKGNNSGKK